PTDKGEREGQVDKNTVATVPHRQERKQEEEEVVIERIGLNVAREGSDPKEKRQSEAFGLTRFEDRSADPNPIRHQDHHCTEQARQLPKRRGGKEYAPERGQRMGVGTAQLEGGGGPQSGVSKPDQHFVKRGRAVMLGESGIVKKGQRRTPCDRGDQRDA